jgi:DNA polymerase-3 subunit chi
MGVRQQERQHRQTRAAAGGVHVAARPGAALTVSQVDFYVLAGSGDLARQQFACRLAEKAYRLNNSVHIETVSEQTAGQLDDLLWTFRDGSFVPHEIVTSLAAKPESPVTIGFAGLAPGSRDLLINLTESIPPAVASFARVAEIVSSDDECKARSRIRFVEYRDDGHTLETHKI